jgi:hypothetical protein
MDRINRIDYLLLTPRAKLTEAEKLELRNLLYQSTKPAPKKPAPVETEEFGLVPQRIARLAHRRDDEHFLRALGVAYDGLVPPKVTKYDAALAECPGRIIVVRCDACGIDYDVREVCNERQHPHANHVMSFDCPRGHHEEARRVFKSLES